MELDHMKRIVDCLTPRDALGLWGLEAIAKELGLDDVAKKASDIGDKMFDLRQSELRMIRERDDLIDSAADIRPEILLKIAELREVAKKGILR